MTTTHSRQQTQAPWHENEAIVSRIQNGDTDAYQDLWNANKRLVAHYAMCYMSLVERRASIDLDDLIQCGYIGLHTAAQKYSPERGMKFSSFAAFYIKNEIRRCVGVGRKRNPADMALSLDAPLTLDNDDERTVGDTLITEDETGSLETEDLRGTVRTTLMRLVDDLIRCIVWEHHWNKRTSVQAAELYGISAEEARSLLKKGYRLLRRDETLQEWASIYGYAS